ncbi:MAG: hypothetical protein E6J81_06740 [Deltaproteobacteria bacterium]|nr:MAG: hypothetical protein E6J81_06740 [Deltaproteobacteria bacterium]TMA79117.1 MAG: hypothetical protein E6J77_20085 [Deltaproteobacteria bacterium]
MIGAGEVLVLVALVALLYWALSPLRRRLEVWIRRRLAPRRSGRGQVVVLERRRDGTFSREDRHDG